MDHLTSTVLCVYLVTAGCGQLEKSLCSHSCQHGVSPTGTDWVGCRCDPLCAVYGDCCIDSPHKYKKSVRRVDVSCVHIPGYGHVYMVDQCPQDWSGPDSIKGSCDSDNTDASIWAPVTSSATGVTYRNYPCAQCHGDSDIIPWKMDVKGKSTDHSGRTRNDTIHRTMGGTTRFRGSRGKHKDISVAFMSPRETTMKPRRCSPSVSVCPLNYPSDTTRQMCDSYLDPVWMSSTRYRNAHCALCNNVTRASLSCNPVSTLSSYQDSLELDTKSVPYLSSIEHGFATNPAHQLFGRYRRSRRNGDRDSEYHDFGDPIGFHCTVNLKGGCLRCDSCGRCPTTCKT